MCLLPFSYGFPSTSTSTPPHPSSISNESHKRIRQHTASLTMADFNAIYKDTTMPVEGTITIDREEYFTEMGTIELAHLRPKKPPQTL